MWFKAAILVGQRVSFVAKFDREFRSAASRVGVNENVGDALVLRVHYQRLVDQVDLAAIRRFDWLGFRDVALEDKLIFKSPVGAFCGNATLATTAQNENTQIRKIMLAPFSKEN